MLLLPQMNKRIKTHRHGSSLHSSRITPPLIYLDRLMMHQYPFSLLPDSLVNVLNETIVPYATVPSPGEYISRAVHHSPQLLPQGVGHQSWTR
jgi:hypothetical protein